jgi:hypothetical protein
MKILQALDVFGVAYNFNLNNSQSYKSPFGGVMSIFCLFMLTVFMYFFGIDFYYKKNPKVIGSTVYNQDYYTTPLNSSQGILAWKIEDHYTVMPNFTGILFPRIVYKKFLEDPETKFLNLIDAQILPQKRCDQVEDVDPILKTNYDLKAWWCLDFTGTNFTFGGYWGGKVVNMIYLLIDACNEDKSHCSSIKEVQSLAPGAENSLFFSMLYPQAYFSPNDLNTPLNYAYYYFTETIDLHVIKKNVFFFTKYMLEDDLGWMAQDIRTSSIFVYQSFFKDYFYKDASKWSNVTMDQNTVVYMNGLYFDKNPFLYTRSFMKLQDLAAVVGGALKSTILVFAIFSKYVNSLGLITYLGNVFFTEKASQTVPNKSYDNIANESREIKKSRDLFKNESIKKDNFVKEKHSNEINNSVVNNSSDLKQVYPASYINNPLVFNYKNLQTKTQNEAVNKPEDSEQVISITKFYTIPLISKKIQNKIFYVKNLICPCNKDKKFGKNFEHVKKYMKNKISLEHYIENNMLFENLLDVLLDKSQRTLINCLPQIDLNDQEKLDRNLRENFQLDKLVIEKALNEYNIQIKNKEANIMTHQIVSLVFSD